MTLNEMITYAQKHNVDFDKPVTAVLDMNETLPLEIFTWHRSVSNNLVLHTTPIEVFKAWRIALPLMDWEKD